MRPYSLSVAARKDMIEIGRHTAEKWGKRQRDKCLRQLDDAFKLLARQPEIGKDTENIRAGYSKFSHGSQIIFYRAGKDSKIVVIRILHNSMDVDRHL